MSHITIHPSPPSTPTAPSPLRRKSYSKLDFVDACIAQVRDFLEACDPLSQVFNFIRFADELFSSDFFVRTAVKSVKETSNTFHEPQRDEDRPLINDRQAFD